MHPVLHGRVDNLLAKRYIGRACAYALNQRLIQWEQAVPLRLFEHRTHALWARCRGGLAAAAAVAAVVSSGCRMWPDVPQPKSSDLPYSRTEEVGKSVKGRPIKLIEVGRGEEVVLVFGGFHGDEWQGTYVAERLVDYLIAMRSIPPSRKVVVVPEVNPDGLAVRKRFNANGVDINRNFPTANWRPADPESPERHGLRPASEPETQIVRDLIWRYRPKLIVALHTIRRGRHCVNYDGPAEDLAEAMSQCCGYPVSRFLGYASPGSLGTFAGVERNIPTITLEMPRNETSQACWHQVRTALLAAVAYAPEPAPAAAK